MDRSSISKRPLKLLFETGDGRSASALLENGFIRHCRNIGAELHVLSPGACYQPFVESYQEPGVSFSYLDVEQVLKSRHPRMLRWEKRVGNLLVRLGYRRARQILWKAAGARILADDAGDLVRVLDEVQPDCLVTAHLNQGFSRGLIAHCALRGIPTLGNVFSWDHPFYPQRSRPDRLSCWSPWVKDGLIKRGGFLPEQIEPIGAPIFDAYLAADAKWSRQKLCERMNLDPARPIIVFATLGQMQMFWDETGTFRAFLDALDRARLPGPPQIVLRLHPISIEHYFDDFRARPDVVISRYSRYCPCMRWWPSRDETMLAGNLLRHAAVCISPGSSMTVEPAIFDTPAVMPVFNPIIPESYERFFQRNWLDKHFRLPIQENAVAVARTPDECIAAIRHAMEDPAWMSEGRRTIREKLLGPLDGRATECLAKLAVECAREKFESSKVLKFESSKVLKC